MWAPAMFWWTAEGMLMGAAMDVMAGILIMWGA